MDTPIIMHIATTHVHTNNLRVLHWSARAYEMKISLTFILDRLICRFEFGFHACMCLCLVDVYMRIGPGTGYCTRTCSWDISL